MTRITFSQLGNFGRLGNQLFQIASTIGIAERNNAAYCFPEWKYENNFVHTLPHCNISPSHRYHEQGFNYQEISLSSGDDWDLHGYFQSEKYFLHCSDTVRKHFEFKPELKMAASARYRDIDLSGSVSIHIRRGDYLLLPDYHTNLSLEWYERALSYFDSNVPKLIFSDDLKWCRENLKWSNLTFVEGNECEDMYLMSCCSGNIIANSSFSWWGAWLNKNERKTVVAPGAWFGPASDVDSKDLLPSEWITIY